MVRPSGWETRFTEAMQAAASTPFAWGSHDCVSFAASIVAVVTGSDPMADWRGHYKTEIGAARVIRRATGGAGLIAALDQRFERLDTPKLAQRGDLGVKDTPKGPALGVCGGRSWGFVSKDGLVFVGIGDITAAWRV